MAGRGAPLDTLAADIKHVSNVEARVLHLEEAKDVVQPSN